MEGIKKKKKKKNSSSPNASRNLKLCAGVGYPGIHRLIGRLLYKGPSSILSASVVPYFLCRSFFYN
jgi:hypothetical protein